MNIGKGHWVFAALFFIAFVVAMIWAYRSDRPSNTQHYSGAYKIIFGIITVGLLVFLFVKLKTHH